MKTYNNLISRLSSKQVFVFGSNPMGINGNPKRRTGGAALWALENAGVKQGEKMDNTVSSSGKAYGITTVKRPGARRSLTKQQIEENIRKFYQYARKNRNKQFMVAYTNVGNIKTLNGYSGFEMGNMFRKASPRIPSYVYFNSNFVNMIK